MTEVYRVRVKRGDFEVEVESTDRGYVDQKLKEYLVDAPPSAATVAGASAGELDAHGKALSLPEFVRRVNPKGGPQAAVTVAYFIEKHGGQREVPTKDIIAGFKTTKKIKVSNPSDAIGKAKAQGSLMDGQAKRTIVVTGTGEQWIKERLSANENSG